MNLHEGSRTFAIIHERSWKVKNKNKFKSAQNHSFFLRVTHLSLRLDDCGPNVHVKRTLEKEAATWIAALVGQATPGSDTLRLGSLLRTAILRQFTRLSLEQGMPDGPRKYP